VQQKKNFIAARNTQHVRRRPPEENQGLHRAGHYFFLETKTNQAREGKTKFSLSLSISLASQFLKTLLAAAFEASSTRKLVATTIRNKSKLTRSPALLSLSLSVSVLLLLPRLLGNPRLGNGDWYTREERNERPLNPSPV
jgi:hypothetical protein